jgi:hypothetical protein
MRQKWLHTLLQYSSYLQEYYTLMQYASKHA